MELIRHSVREGLTYEWVSIFSLPLEMLITLLIPDFFGDMLQVSYWGKNYLWEMSVYVGIIPLSMLIVALIHIRSRQVWIFGVVAVASCLLALGKYTPLLRLLYTYVPGFNMFRGLSKFVFIFAFASAILAGFGAGKTAHPRCGALYQATLLGFDIACEFYRTAHYGIDRLAVWV